MDASASLWCATYEFSGLCIDDNIVVRLREVPQLGDRALSNFAAPRDHQRAFHLCRSCHGREYAHNGLTNICKQHTPWQHRRVEQ